MHQDLFNLLNVLDAAAEPQATTEDLDIEALDEIVNEYINQDPTARAAQIRTQQDELVLPQHFDLLGKEKIIDDYLNMDCNQSWTDDFFLSFEV